MNKSFRQARRLSDLVGTSFDAAFRRQGFAAREVVTRWPDIIGEDLAALCEPMRLQWARVEDPEPGTLVLRVEGPAAIEVQHSSAVIIERVNRFFGWQAVDRIALRQAPLVRRRARPARPAPDAAAARRIADALPIADEPLRAALGRLGAAIKSA